MDDEARDKCGVFGVWAPAPEGSPATGAGHTDRAAHGEPGNGDGRAVAPDCGHLAYTALYAQQHRGQESAGISVVQHGRLAAHTGMGLVSEVFDSDTLARLNGGRAAIGHNRYSTAGASQCENAQPLMENYVGGQVAVGHNGNLVNARLLREAYEKRGHIFHTSSDTEVMIHLLASHHQNKTDPLAETLQHLQGAYSAVFLFPDRIEAVRDPWGWRPLVLGRLVEGHLCVASETVALDAVGAAFEREVEPGEIVTLSDAGVQSRRFAERKTPAYCAFEHVYFANPSSKVFGETVQLVRERLGEKLAEEGPALADCVIPMPDSGRSASLGYARQSGIPYREGIVPNRYVGRTFIQPTQVQRDSAVQLKLNTVAEVIDGNRIVVVDDSIVRGTTTRGKMAALRRAGAKEIHLRISSPPIRHACYFGIDFPDESKLIAHQRSVEQIRDFLGVDSLHFLSIEGMLSCMSRPKGDYCTACWSGRYRIDPENPVNKLDLERDQLKMFT